jgi:hypothetical protein
LFLRKAEAAYLKIQDIEIPVDKATGDPLMGDGGIPRYVFIHIRRSKTDQAAAGMCHVRSLSVHDRSTYIIVRH